jgi:3-isopropylmalate/(R)-2-methylmalate dehydratase large subunit
VDVCQVAGKPVDSVFIGSCTNGRFEDLAAAAEVLKGRKIADGVVAKIVPATDSVWRRCMREGVFDTLKAAGALISNAGCAGCAAGQVGQNGPGEVTVSTGNRNFPGKQGRGEVYLASPATAAASAIAAAIASAGSIPSPGASRPRVKETASAGPGEDSAAAAPAERPVRISGRVWVIGRDNIDTDMIYHNRHLAVTGVAEMGRYAFGNLAGWEDFPRKVQRGDIVIAGENFGCGSSRQQAVDCFKSLGVQLVVAKSFGAIYERNAVNAALAIIAADLVSTGIADGEVIWVDFATGRIRRRSGEEIQGRPFSDLQMDIYRRGGLLHRTRQEA